MTLVSRYRKEHRWLKWQANGIFNNYAIVSGDSSTIQKQRPIRTHIVHRVKNGLKRLEFIKLKAMHHNIVVIKVLERVCNMTFPVLDLHNPRLTARGI
jgi:hypothetical protein